MKKFNKSYAWTPSISNLTLLFFFCQIRPSKFWKFNETKRLDFYQFLRFSVVKTFLKSYEVSSMYIGERWDKVTWSKKLNLKKQNYFSCYIKLPGSISSVTVWQNQAVSTSRHYTIVHHNME